VKTFSETLKIQSGNLDKLLDRKKTFVVIESEESFIEIVNVIKM